MQDPGASKAPKISKVIHWRSPDGKHCVVSGPFPDGLYRGDTHKGVKGAAKTHPDDMWVHGDTTREDRFAKVMTKDVIEVFGGDNEFGPVSP